MASGDVVATCSDIAAAGPPWVRDLLAAATGDALVVHSGPEAVYLEVDHDVIAVLARHAVVVPCALRTTLTSTRDLALDGRPPAPGTRVSTTPGRLHFAAADVRVARATNHRSPVIDPGAAPQMTARLARAFDPAAGPPRAELPEAALRTLAAADPDAVEALLGLGSGLTPLGDDVLCGWLATVVAADHPCATPFGDRVLASARERTTALSATLLRRAVHAEVVPQFTDLVHALTERPDAVGRAVHDLTSIGHTSGSGLALGLALALDHLGSRSTCP